MILLIRKRAVHRTLAVFAAGILAAALAAAALQPRTALQTAGQTALTARRIFVIDPGHGGEDGGASSKSGMTESGLNLQISEKIYYLLKFSGNSCGMTRNRDVSIYSDGAETLRQKKVSDLKNRVSLVNQTKNGFLISIHQNYLPAPGVHGAQVFYNTQPGAKETGLQIQQALNETVNLQRSKTAKAILPSIYLMKEIHRPGVLIECGFLSNAEEAEKLKQPSYQTLLAASVVSGVLSS